MSWARRAASMAVRVVAFEPGRLGDCHQCFGCRGVVALGMQAASGILGEDQRVGAQPAAAAAPRRATSSGTEASWPSSTNRVETSSNSCRARGRSPKVANAQPRSWRACNRRELLPERAIQSLGLLEVGDRRGELAAARPGCRLDCRARGPGRASSGSRRSRGMARAEQSQCLIDPARVAAQRGALQLGDVAQLVRPEPVHLVEVGERGGPTPGDREHAGECQMGVGGQFVVAGSLRRRDRLRRGHARRGRSHRACAVLDRGRPGHG